MRKLFKKALACCLVAALALTCFVGALTVSAAAGSAVVTGTTVTEGATEATVKVTLTSEDADGIHAAIVTLSSDFGAITSVVDADETNNFWVDEGDINGNTFLVQARSNEVNAKVINLNVTFAAEAAPAVGTYAVAVTAGTVPAASWNENVTEFTTLTGADIVVEAAVEEPTYNTITAVKRGASLNLEGAITVNLFFALDGLTISKADAVANGGVLVWTQGTVPSNPEEAIVGSETYSCSFVDAGVYQGVEEYSFTTEGIPAKEYADRLAYRPYVEIDGKCYYGDILDYAVKDYAVGRFEKAKDEKIKQLCVALLNYGAAAQTYFKYNTDALMNADLQTYVNKGWIDASYLNIVNEWDNAYIDELVPVDDNMAVNFQKSGVITDNGNALTLVGAVEINYYVGVGTDPSILEGAKDHKMYFWTSADYAALKAAGTPLSKTNASYTKDLVKDFADSGSTKYGWESEFVSDGVYAKQLGATLYSAYCFEDADGVEHCSGIRTYSPETYAKGRLNSATAKEDIKALSKALVVYGNYANAYFAK